MKVIGKKLLQLLAIVTALCMFFFIWGFVGFFGKVILIIVSLFLYGIITG